jgi:type IV pilus assembly protein PilP
MNKHLAIIRNFIGLICLAFFLWGCEKPAEPPAAPQVVRKKIVAQAEVPKPTEAEKPAQAEPVKPTAETAPAAPAQPEPKAAPGVSKEPETPPAKAVATAPSAGISPESKPALEPKSAVAMLSESAAAMTAEDKPVEEEKAEAPGKVDPFAPLFKEEAPQKPEDVAEAAQVESKRRIPLTPLEKVDLSQLKLVGIIRSPSGEKALVEEASGKGYIVTKGTYIGLNAGRVLYVLDDRIVIEEEFENALGKVSISRTELQLQKPPGEF